MWETNATKNLSMPTYTCTYGSTVRDTAVSLSFRACRRYFLLLLFLSLFSPSSRITVDQISLVTFSLVKFYPLNVCHASASLPGSCNRVELLSRWKVYSQKHSAHSRSSLTHFICFCASCSIALPSFEDTTLFICLIIMHGVVDGHWMQVHLIKVSLGQEAQNTKVFGDISRYIWPFFLLHIFHLCVHMLTDLGLFDSSLCSRNKPFLLIRCIQVYALLPLHEWPWLIPLSATMKTLSAFHLHPNAATKVSLSHEPLLSSSSWSIDLTKFSRWNSGYQITCLFSLQLFPAPSFDSASVFPSPQPRQVCWWAAFSLQFKFAVWAPLVYCLKCFLLKKRLVINKHVLARAS